MMISVILPAYNEEDYIEGNVSRIIREMERITKEYEVIVVEESSDKTPEIIQRLKKKYRKIRHFNFNRRLGKGKPLEYGIKVARGKSVIFMDIALATDLSALRLMVDELKHNDIVIGSRYHPQSRTDRTALRVFLGRSYALLLRVMFLSPLRDHQCGFKGFRKDAGLKIIQHTASAGTFWDTEFLFFARKCGFKIKEIPVVWNETRGRSAKISLKLIALFAFSSVRLFFTNLFGKQKLH